MESLVEQGESWMRPLLDFRNLLAETTNPERKAEFRNFRRRTGQVTFARGNLQDDTDGSRVRKHVPGPYWMRYRREWLERLLVMQRDLAKQGHELELLSEVELHRIRREWLNDPNEPDWEDHLPQIYKSVYGRDLDWVESDAGTFTQPDAELINELGTRHSIPGTLIRKLLDLEVAMDGLSKRRGMTERIHSILTEEWRTLDAVIESEEVVDDGGYQEELDCLQSEVISMKESRDV